MSDSINWMAQASPNFAKAIFIMPVIRNMTANIILITPTYLLGDVFLKFFMIYKFNDQVPHLLAMILNHSHQ
jgi:hypothetical protein